MKKELSYSELGECHNFSSWFYHEWNFINCDNKHEVGIRFLGLEIIKYYKPDRNRTRIRSDILRIAVFCLFIMIFLFLFAFFAMPVKGNNLNIMIGKTSEIAPGASNDTPITKLDIEYVWTKPLLKNFSYDKSVYGTVLVTDGEAYLGFGYKMRLNYHITDNLIVFMGAGGLYILDGGEIDGLASSWVYGSIEGGFKYYYFVAKAGHNSSPLHHADQGDSGANFLFTGVSIPSQVMIKFFKNIFNRE